MPQVKWDNSWMTCRERAFFLSFFLSFKCLIWLGFGYWSRHNANPPWMLRMHSSGVQYWGDREAPRAGAMALLQWIWSRMYAQRGEKKTEQSHKCTTCMNGTKHNTNWEGRIQNISSLIFVFHLYIYTYIHICWSLLWLFLFLLSLLSYIFCFLFVCLYLLFWLLFCFIYNNLDVYINTWVRI